MNNDSTGVLDNETVTINVSCLAGYSRASPSCETSSRIQLFFNYEIYLRLCN